MSLADIRRMAQNLNRLPLGIRNRVAVAVKDEMQALLDEQFDQGIGPDGEPWAPLRPSTLRRGRTPPPLSDTEAMRGSVQAVRVGTNVAIEADFPAQAHQKGNPPRLARRAIWPDEDQLPERYRVPIEYAATRAIAAAVSESDLGKAAE